MSGPDTVKAIIFDVKEFALHDGRGIRTTVFFKGCPLRCLWCHNPEGQAPEPELFQQRGCKNCGLCRRGCRHEDCRPWGRCLHICPDDLITVAGREVSCRALAREIKSRADSSFGITLSGGEPLMQPAAAFALLEEFGGREGDTCIETCGFCSPEIFGELRRRCRFVYMDLKLADDEEHKKYTGRSNRPIIENLAQLRGSGADYMLRVPLVPGITDTDENLRGLSRLAGSSPVELLEYNTLAGAKYEGVGRKYSLGKGRSRSAEEAAAFFEEPVIRR